MTVLDLYEVEAFGAGLPFRGNPAAVVPLDAFLPDTALQAIAAANNLAETAYLVPGGRVGHYALRWKPPISCRAAGSGITPCAGSRPRWKCRCVVMRPLLLLLSS